MRSPRRYFIETFGCQMNVHDSERLAGVLEADGHVPAAAESDADVIVLNTCSVRERAEDKLYTRLGEIEDAAVAAGRRPLVVVAGCVAQQEGAALLRRRGLLDVVLGTQSLKQLPRHLEETLARSKPVVDVDLHDDVSFPLGLVRHADPIRASVTIIEGCNEFCAFCVVPYTRGHERMRPARDILAEVAHAVGTGHLEVQLLGQIVNHYQAPDDPACDFPTLLERVSAVPGLARLRFSSPHPRYVNDRLIHAIRDLPIVCKQLHLPLQSGSDRVLRSMRRRYSRTEYLDLVDRVRTEVPGIAISTDVIVGYPGESDTDFEDTMDIARRVRFNSMYSFKYSVRPNTLADKRLIDDVQEGEKTRRIVALQALQRDLQVERHTRAIGTIEQVLVDSLSRRRREELAGKTSGGTIVNFPGPVEWMGRLIDVQITEGTPNALRGRALDLVSSTEVQHAD